MEGQGHSMPGRRLCNSFWLQAVAGNLGSSKPIPGLGPSKALSPYCYCHLFKFWGSLDSGGASLLVASLLLPHCHITSRFPPALKDSEHNKTSFRQIVSILPLATQLLNINEYDSGIPLLSPLLTTWGRAATAGFSNLLMFTNTAHGVFQKGMSLPTSHLGTQTLRF